MIKMKPFLRWKRKPNLCRNPISSYFFSSSSISKKQDTHIARNSVNMFGIVLCACVYPFFVEQIRLAKQIEREIAACCFDWASNGERTCFMNIESYASHVTFIPHEQYLIFGYMLTLLVLNIYAPLISDIDFFFYIRISQTYSQTTKQYTHNAKQWNRKYWQLRDSVENVRSPKRERKKNAPNKERR